MATLERRRSAKERYASFRFNAVTRLDLEFWGWGRNDYGQLGTGHEEHQAKPLLLEAFENKDIVHIAGNSWCNTAAISDDGDVFMMGLNDVGQLGMKKPEVLNIPTRVSSLDLHRVTHLATGFSHVLATTEQGVLMAWGSNEHGQLGYETQNTFSTVPKRIKHDKALHFVRVAAGSGHSLALTAKGEVYSCGQGEFGALGHDDTTSLPLFSHILALTGVGVIQIDCGEYHSVALSVDGRVWTWGRGKYGQLGHGDRHGRSRPTPVTSFSEHPIANIACGDSHTLCCGGQGKVYSWGHSKWGQTGTGSTENVLSPLRIEQLNDEYITQVSCGSRHSLVLTQRGAIFAFGNGELGQLGNELFMEVCPDPQPVLHLPSYPPICILASLLDVSCNGADPCVIGGDHCLVMFHKTTPSVLCLDFGRYGQGMRPFKVMDLNLLIDAVEKAKGISIREAMESYLSALDDIYSSPGFLLHAFTSSQPVGRRKLKIDTITRTYERIFRSYDQQTIVCVGSACIACLNGVIDLTMARQMRDRDITNRLREWANVLVILMLNPLFGEAHASGGAMVQLTAVLLEHLPSGAIELLESLLTDLPVELFGGRLINGAQKHLTHIARDTDGLDNPIQHGQRDEVLKVCELLDLFYQVNAKRSEAVSFHRFYNQSVSDGLDLRHEWIAWNHLMTTDHDGMMGHGVQTICQTPFVLTPEAKAKITQGEAMISKTAAIQESALGALFSGINPAVVSFLDINIRRDHIREDAMIQLLLRGDDLQKPLRVKFFSNGIEEEGQDEGGLSKEFFQLLVEEIFNVDFAMFVYSEETRNFWFSHQALEVEDFRLVGIVLGLAIYNNVILDVHFPLVVYKKLKGLETTLADLKDAFPQLGNGLQQLLDFEGDVENVFCRSFEVEYEYFGEMMTAELKPGGGSIPVTKENRQEYVELYTHYILDDSIREQFKVFKEGFLKVVVGHSLKLYRYEELELLICGLPHLDFRDLEKVARYDGGYTAEHPTVRNFWSVIHSLPMTDKKKFLAFATGCDRAPVGGLSKLPLLIQRSGPDSNRLPSSHTCFNVLLLPDYCSREKLQERLIVAIQDTQGFGLQ